MPTTITTHDHHGVQTDTPATGHRTPRGPRHAEHRGTIRAAVIAAVVLVAVTAAFWATSSPVPEQAEPTTSEVLSQDEALRQLIARGYVPGDAFDAEAEVTRALQQRGLVPDGIATPPPLYTPDEEAVLRLVSIGVLPDEVLEAEVFVTKRLINRGLVPAGSAR